MSFLKKIKEKFLSIFGDIKIFKFPFFIIYSPGSFNVKGTQTREAMNLLKPGDLILRKYINYLDGYFIPGKYSHTGIYIGDGKIIHAVAEGVSIIDVIDFLRCDHFCILRQDSQKLADKAVFYVNDVLKNKGKYDFDFVTGNGKWYCHELGALAYSDMNIKQLSAKKFGIKLAPRFLAESFLEDNRFTKVFEY